MFSSQSYVGRRETLRAKVGSGVILLPANQYSPYNYLNNAYSFRQDSMFLYYFGLTNPGFVGVLDTQSGEDMLFGDDFTVDDIIWMGPQPSLKELGAKVGVDNTYSYAELAVYLNRVIAQGRQIHFLPPYRGETKLQLSELLGISPAKLHEYKSVELMFATAEQRETKSAEEIEQMELAFEIGYQMHLKAMSMCREGVTEREIAGAIEGIALSLGSGVSFHSIVSQHGETLHNHDTSGTLQTGKLLLCDAGAESINYYCSDHTRTYPVGGKFSQKQKDIYNIVLDAHSAVVHELKADMMYMDLHRVAQLRLAEGLKGVGLISGSAEDAVAAGAISLFMPHGLGHGLGMDVHDCENIGERSFDFSTIAERAAQSATCVHRATWRLREGTVLTDEPGIYFIPALIDKYKAEGLHKGIINYDALDAYRDFGGIRLEDDLIVTKSGARMIGGEKKIPITVEEVEAVVGK